uniref:RING-type E3 ubiquitin transferase n=1 Tax=Branchiostoma floridae TaxID=7739 RepID=C3ZJ62_BRAFL|eukprot:XP_002591382.1 hypothetical protein BRAFLDRAFT_86889 [Branchiostoma floridae]
MAAAPSSLGEQISEELACSICLELFTRPKVLPCQHTFCRDCLQDHAGKKKHLKCPNCRQQVRLPPQGVAGLQDNHLVTSLCERLQNQATLSGETREQPQSGNRCSFHPSEDVKVYCKQCNVPVCNECLDEAHSDHRTITLKKASQERKAPVQALIADGRNILETYCGFLRRLRENEKSLDKKKQQTDNSVIQAYSQMVQKLTENRDLLLSEVDKRHKKNKEVVQKERDRILADVNEMSAACDQAEQELEAGGVQYLGVQETNLTEVVRKYRGKAAPTPVQTQPAVFQPTDTPVPVLGHVTVPGSVSPAPIPIYEAETMTFGEEGSGTGQFQGPVGVTVSDEGEIFVADFGNQRIQVFTLQGTFVRQFPTVIPSSSLFSFLLYPFHQTFMSPYDMAMDGEGNLWVVGYADLTSGEVLMCAVQYNKQGRVLRKFDLQKTGGVAVDTRRNHILITHTTGDLFNLRGEVQVFRPDGTLVRTVGQKQGMKPADAPVLGHVKSLLPSTSSNVQKAQTITLGVEGSESGEFNRPLGVAVSDEGEIFVADCYNQRIQVFTLQGTFVCHFLTIVPSFRLFSFPLQFQQTYMHPQSVAIDGKGNLWVVGNTETAESAVQYNKQGRVLRMFDLQMTACDRLVAVDTRRNHILITQTTGDGDKLHGEVLVYRPDGTLVRTVGQKQGMKHPWSIAVDREGNILVSDADDCIFMYDESGQFLFRFEGAGRGENDLSHPHGELCTDRAGNITVVRCGSFVVDLFDKTGRFLRSIATDLDMTEPHSVAMATQGQLVVTDPQANTVHIIRSCETAATQMMQNPQMQQMLGNLLGSGGAPSQAPSSGEAPAGPGGLNMSEFLQAGQQMAQQIQQQNPELVEQLRTQMPRNPPDGDPDNPDGKPDEK